MRFFKNRGYIGIILTAAAGSMIYYSLSVLWPTQIAVMYTSDPIEIGWMSCAVGGSTLLGQLTAGLLVKRLGRQKIQLIFCAICMATFITAMASTNRHTRSRAVAFTCIGSFFVGYIELCSLTTAPLCLEDKDIRLATGILGSTHTGLAAIALSVYISVLNNKLLVNIPKYVISAATSADSLHLLSQHFWKVSHQARSTKFKGCLLLSLLKHMMLIRQPTPRHFKLFT
jgi:hypothetical protein